MNRIVGPERVPIRERNGLPDEPVGDLQPHVSLPVRVELGDETPMLTDRQVACASTSRECRACLDVRDRRGRHENGLAHLRPRRRRTNFLDVELHEGAGIEIEVQRRSSRMVRLTGLPRTRAGCAAPRGFPPPQEASPSRTIPATIACSGGASGGAMTATGRPRSVTVMRSPPATRRRNSLNRFFRFRTPTVVTSRPSLVATLYGRRGYTPNSRDPRGRP